MAVGLSLSRLWRSGLSRRRKVVSTTLIVGVPVLAVLWLLGRRPSDQGLSLIPVPEIPEPGSK